MIPIRIHGIAKALRMSSGMACTTIAPSATPSTVPSMAPTAEMMTASQRIIRRVCLRTMPTARSRPSSRVRSKTERASVFAMPSRAIKIVRASRIVSRLRMKSIWFETVSRNSALDWNWKLGNSEEMRSNALSAVPLSTPPAIAAATLPLSFDERSAKRSVVTKNSPDTCDSS